MAVGGCGGWPASHACMHDEGRGPAGIMGNGCTTHSLPIVSLVCHPRLKRGKARLCAHDVVVDYLVEKVAGRVGAVEARYWGVSGTLVVLTRTLS